MDEINKIIDGNTQHRIIKQRTIFRNQDLELESGKYQITTIEANGNIETEETESLVLIDGETISDLKMIMGQCQESKCSKYLTQRTIRYCHFCGKINCMVCSNWDDKEEKWLCKDCLKKLKRKRILRAIGRILLAPFSLGRRK